MYASLQCFGQAAASPLKLDHNTAAYLLLDYHDAVHKHLNGDQTDTVVATDNLLALPAPRAKNKDGNECEYCTEKWKNLYGDKTRSNSSIVKNGRRKYHDLQWLRTKNANEQQKLIEVRDEDEYKFIVAAETPQLPPKSGGPGSHPWICPKCWEQEIKKLLPVSNPDTSQTVTDMDEVD
eukprot:COSAG02_NODE_5054_length_4687_cov_7.076504_4_plen_179_part_00